MKPSISNATAFVFSAAIIGFSAIPARAADETYLLAKKDYIPPIGTVITKDHVLTMKDAAVKIKAQGQERAGTSSRLRITQEITEVISPTKIRVTIVKSDDDESMTINGQEQKPPAKPEALLNTPFLLELKNEKWSASLENDKEPTESQKAGLKKRAKSANCNAGVEMYGSAPHKVGDQWKADPSKIGFDAATDIKGDYTVKFVEVKEVNGVKCAVLKTTYDFKGTPLDAGNPSALGMKGEAVSIRSITDMIDLDVKMEGNMTMELTPQPGVAIHLGGRIVFTEKVSIKKP